MHSLSIVIVNYKTPELTSNCIQSLLDHLSPEEVNMEVIVVDNDSQDDSQTRITSRFPAVKWISNLENSGFGRANNLGIAQTRYSNVLLLNSDTLVHDQSILRMLDYLHTHPLVGLATCQLLNEDGSPQRSVFPFNAGFEEVLRQNLALDVLLYRKREVPKKVRAISGACILFDKTRLEEKTGFFDGDFFMYSEEFEWCHRVQKAGLTIEQIPEATLYHLEEKSSSSKDWNVKQRHASAALLFRKNRGFGGYLLYLFLLGFNDLTNLLLLIKMTSEYRKNYFRSLRIRWVLIPIFIGILFGSYRKPLKIRS